jgi:hypothetical protein
MKTFILKLLVLTVVSLPLFGCRDFTPSSYGLAFPRAPENWVSLLGEPHWRLEWLDPGGNRRIADLSPAEASAGKTIEIPATWANPVTAWPYWQAHNLPPGLFKPAGALFPFDVSGERLCLSWKAGVDSVFYWELALAASQKGEGGNITKIPANFDWPRFRLLFEDEVLNAAVRADPWLVDWSFVAERTMNANFDRRRLVPQPAEALPIPVPAGVWYGTSPFAQPLQFEEDEIPVFPVSQGVNAWVSTAGILRCSGKTWVFAEKEVKK